MLRLKVELETCSAEERVEALTRAHEDHVADVNQLKETFAFREQMLRDEIDLIKSKLADRNRRLDEANEKADKQIMQIRMILNKSEQDHQREVNAQLQRHEDELSKCLTGIHMSSVSFVFRRTVHCNIVCLAFNFQVNCKRNSKRRRRL